MLALNKVAADKSPSLYGFTMGSTNIYGKIMMGNSLKQGVTGYREAYPLLCWMRKILL